MQQLLTYTRDLTSTKFDSWERHSDLLLRQATNGLSGFKALRVRGIVNGWNSRFPRRREHGVPVRCCALSLWRRFKLVPSLVPWLIKVFRRKLDHNTHSRLVRQSYSDSSQHPREPKNNKSTEDLATTPDNLKNQGKRQVTLDLIKTTRAICFAQTRLNAMRLQDTPEV